MQQGDHGGRPNAAGGGGANALVSAASADAIERGCKVLLLVTGLALLALLTLGVVLRYFFESGFSFAPDLSELLFAIFVMAGIAQAARLGVHVATQLLLNGLRYRIALAVLIHAVTATVYLLLAWYAFQNAIIAHDQLSPVLRIPWSVGYGCLSAAWLSLRPAARSRSCGTRWAARRYTSISPILERR